jgi:hypothetical protein
MSGMRHKRPFNSRQHTITFEASQLPPALTNPRQHKMAF